MDWLNGLATLLGGKKAQSTPPPTRATPSPYLDPMPYRSPSGQSLPLTPQQNGARGLTVQPTVQAPSGAQWGGLQPSTSFDGNLQGYGQDDLSNGIQGGMVNQGYIPLQSSGDASTAARVQPASFGDALLRLLKGR